MAGVKACIRLICVLSGNKMEKSNYKEWSVGFNGKITLKINLN